MHHPLSHSDPVVVLSRSPTEGRSLAHARLRQAVVAERDRLHKEHTELTEEAQRCLPCAYTHQLNMCRCPYRLAPNFNGIFTLQLCNA